MFKGNKPSAQPRTLRTIAEQKGSNPAGFDGEIPYVPQTGLPVTVKGATELYVDEAMHVTLSGDKSQAKGADPSPFASIRKKG
jgi:hypothetical protein